MALYSMKTLPEALKEIEHTNYYKLPVHELAQKRINKTISRYGNAKWKIVDILNEKFKTNFDLYNWLLFNEQDEVAYFLNEAGSNALSYSKYKAPSAFHLWLGEKGFVIGVEQQGKGFNAEKINREGLKENEGAAFAFFRKCRSVIFFDNPKDARIVLMEFIF